MRTQIINDMKFKRRRLGLTNYKKRLALVKGNMDRVVVRKTNRRIIGQMVSYEEKGDKIIGCADSNELVKALRMAEQDQQAHCVPNWAAPCQEGEGQEARSVLDIGIARPGEELDTFRIREGMHRRRPEAQGQLEIDMKMLDAAKIAKYAETLKGDKAAFKKQFGGYSEKGVQPETLPKLFNEVKAKILQG